MNAISFPFGDQRASRSCAFDEFVRLRVGPFSAGTVKMSPRAANTARSPLGLSAYHSTLFAAEMCEGREARPSSGTVIEIGVDFPVFVSSSCSSPALS